jgi:hypothetical protein
LSLPARTREVSTIRSRAPIAQLAEAADLKSAQCRFESDWGHREAAGKEVIDRSIQRQDGARSGVVPAAGCGAGRSPGAIVNYSPEHARGPCSPGFIRLVMGIPECMNKLTRLRHAQRRIVKVQRRVWLAEALMWLTVIAAGVLSAAGLVWFLRRRSAGGRHEMPDTPGAHEDGSVHVEPDGQLTRP